MTQSVMQLEDDEKLIELAWAWGLAAIPHRANDFGAGSWFLAATIGTPGDLETEAALRRVAEAYVTSPTGREQIHQTGIQPNWGDLIVDVPEEFWAAEGLRVLSFGVSTSRVVVFHDETFEADLDSDDEPSDEEGE